jgi:hypothetical protein
MAGRASCTLSSNYSGHKGRMRHALGLANLDAVVQSLEEVKIVLGAIPGFNLTVKGLVDLSIKICHTAQVNTIGAGRIRHTTEAKMTGFQVK